MAVYDATADSAALRADREKLKEMLTRLGIFTEAEITSRHHVRIERYVKNLQIEIDTLRAMVSTQILPACYEYHGALASAVVSAKAAGEQAPQAETLPGTPPSAEHYEGRWRYHGSSADAPRGRYA